MLGTNLDEIVTAGPHYPPRIAAAVRGERAPYILERDGPGTRLSIYSSPSAPRSP
jgi:hypothetical protein